MPRPPLPLLIECEWSGERIAVDSPIRTVRSLVQSGQIVVLKHALPTPEIGMLRQAVFEWGQSVPASTGSIRGNNDLHDHPHSWHGHLAWPVDRHPPLRLWHGYAFALQDHGVDAAITSQVGWLFHAMRDLHHRLTGMQTLGSGGTGDALRPQIMHYPSGGGARCWEQHRGNPAVISQVASLSERGSDFHVGGTVFESAGHIVDTSDRHGIGDICLFRSDLWHAVTPVDPADPLDLRSQRGRWTAVLPVVG